jgi:hypothetical protein
MTFFPPRSFFQRATPGTHVPWAIPSGAVLGLLAVVMTHGASDAGPVEFSAVRWIIVTTWSLLIITGFMASQQRCSSFQLALPLSARQVWTSQLLSLLVNGGLVLLALAIPTALASLVLERGSLPPLGIAAMLARIASAFWLGVAILQAPSPALYRIPSVRYWTVGTIASGALGTFLGAASGRWRFDWIFMFGVAAALTYWNYRRVPEAYGLEPLKPRAVAAPRSTSWFALPVDFQIARWFQGWVMWIYVPVLAYGGFSFAGAVMGVEQMWLFFLLMTMMHLHTFVLNSGHTLGRVAHLPVSRSRLFALTVVPALFCVSLGHAAGGLFWSAYEARRPVLRACSEAPECFRVPGRFYEIAGTRDLQRIVSPWGEAYELRPVPPIPGSPYGLYSPLETPPGSSPQFVAWQLSRAVEWVYGRSVDPDELQQRYLTPDRSGVLDMWISLARLSRDLGPPMRPKSTHVPIALLFCGALTLLTLPISIGAARRLAQRKPLIEALEGGEGAAWSVPVLIGWTLIIVVPILLSLGDAESWALRAFVEVVAQRAAAAGALVEAGLWLLGLAAMLVGYRLAERQYAQLEAQPSAATKEAS